MIGIDLGTTNSVICTWRDGAAHVIPDAGGRRTTPSVVSIDDDGRVLVGMPARERLRTHPDRTVAAFKRRMGTTAEIELARGKRFRPEELSALVLRKLVADAEAALGSPVRECVISVPAYFNDSQRKATRVAGELAGLDAILINEPTAAAIAYGVHDRRDQQRLAIVDLGGGTLDVSILEFFDGVMEVHATAGDNYLGGDDFDAVLAELLCAHHGIDTKKLSLRERSLLDQQALRAKHALSNGHSTEMTLRRDKGGDLPSFAIDREAFETACKPLLDRTRATLERALRDARLDVRELNDVVLVGGSTRMPMVRSLVGRLFGRLPIAHLSPDEVVGLGAAVQAALRANDAALADFVLTDVCPYTLGIEVAVETDRSRQEAGHFLPIIERNTIVPVSRVERVFPVDAKQKTVVCRIYQGESRLVRNNIELGSIDVPLPKDAQAKDKQSKDAREHGIDVRFTYDSEGILQVTTTVVTTGVVQSLVIQNSGRTLSPEEVQVRLAKLAALEVHPRDVAENRAAVARAERLYEEQLGETRDVIAGALRQFEAALDQQEPRLAENARAELHAFLDRFDRDPFQN